MRWLCWSTWLRESSKGLTIASGALAGGLFLAWRLGRAKSPVRDPDEAAGDVPGLGWIADADHRIIGLGSQFRDHFGSDAYGTACSLQYALHCDDVEEATLQWRRVWETGGEFQGTYRFRGADLEHRWFLSTARALRNQDGQVTGWCGTLVDIHALKLVKEEDPAGYTELAFPARQHSGDDLGGWRERTAGIQQQDKRQLPRQDLRQSDWHADARTRSIPTTATILWSRAPIAWNTLC